MWQMSAGKYTCTCCMSADKFMNSFLWGLWLCTPPSPLRCIRLQCSTGHQHMSPKSKPQSLIVGPHAYLHLGRYSTMDEPCYTTRVNFSPCLKDAHGKPHDKPVRVSAKLLRPASSHEPQCCRLPNPAVLPHARLNQASQLGGYPPASSYNVLLLRPSPRRLRVNTVVTVADRRKQRLVVDTRWGNAQLPAPSRTGGSSGSND